MEIENNKIHILLYADDQVQLATTPNELQKKIRKLEDYFRKNHFSVNNKKTKVMIFQQGGKRKKYRFMWGHGELQIVDLYTYLGIPFSSTLNYNIAADYFKRKGEKAAAYLHAVIFKS